MGLSTNRIYSLVEENSEIRRQFELGLELKKQGHDVLDASLGSPSIGPGLDYHLASLSTSLDGLRDYITGNNRYGYIPNAGHQHVRDSIAQQLKEEFQIPFRKDHIFLTAGAANAINILLSALIEPPITYHNGQPHIREGILNSDGSMNQDEVFFFVPAFAEYEQYAKRNMAGIRTIRSKDNMRPDLYALEEGLNRNSRVMILNNGGVNPTGILYSRQEIIDIADILNSNSAEYGRPIAVIEDAPYRRLVWEGEFNSILQHYEHAFHVDSISKSLGAASRRLGWIAVNPKAGSDDNDRDTILQALTINTRHSIVNAPDHEQKVIGRIGIASTADFDRYRKNLEFMTDLLDKYRVYHVKPESGFYIWMKPDMEPDVFRQKALESPVKLLYGSGFLYDPGWIRLSAAIPSEELPKLETALGHIFGSHL